MPYRPDIDGLRGIAVLVVLLFHAGFTTFNGGFVGVDVFFVISGYLITGIIIDELERGRLSLLVFFRRRILRIVPALLLLIALYVPLALALLPPKFQHEVIASVPSVALFFANIHFYDQRGYFEVAAKLQPFLHTWTLGVEAQFYLIAPLLLIAVRVLFWQGLGWFLAFGTVLSFAYALYAVENTPSFAFFMLSTRAWELLVGGMAAWLTYTGRVPNISRAGHEAIIVFSLFLILFAVFNYSEDTTTPGLPTLAPVLGAAGLCLYGAKTTLAITLLRNPPMILLGLASYSTYLWHQPIFAMFRIRSADPLGTMPMVALCAISIAIGLIAWKLVEQPFKRGFLVNKPTTAIVAVVGLFVLSTAGTVIKPNVEQAIDDALVVAGTSIAIPPLFRGIKYQGRNCSLPNFDDRPVCIIPGERRPDESALRLVILGDSHARVLSESLFERTSLYTEMVDLTASGCPFLLGHGIYYADGEISKNCTPEYQQKRLNFLKKYTDERTVIVVSARLPLYLYGDDFDNTVGGPGVRTKRIYASRDGDFTAATHHIDFFNALDSSLEAISGLDGRVVLVLPTHVNGWDPVVRSRMLAPDATSLTALERALEIPIGPVKARTKEIDAALLGFAQRNETVSTVNPREKTCSKDKGICMSLVNGVFLFQGSDHLSLHANRLLADLIQQQLHNF